ncbi:hypothetical protein [Bacillus sp. SG-1]|uniref:hypothetical protein n=1 Tax=Bacillus sp. SG-1 TaxID=161544 RepID=UPI0001543E8C|nr:hypothetical protein [Bacillus sp. SG-1]EDL65003.1 hypothetical protein BSG1_14819 [Bacillus sp. SG-1]
MPKMRKEFFIQILASNGIDYSNLTQTEIEFRALGILGYKGTVADRRRTFYQSRTGKPWLVDAINENDPDA